MLRANLELCHTGRHRVRVYGCTAQNSPVLLKSLTPVEKTAYFSEYVDDEWERPGQSARIYIFRRDYA